MCTRVHYSLDLVLLLLKSCEEKTAKRTRILHNTRRSMRTSLCNNHCEQQTARFNASDCKILVPFKTRTHWKMEIGTRVQFAIENAKSRFMRGSLKIMPIFNVKAKTEHNCGMLYWNRQNWIVYFHCVRFFATCTCFGRVHLSILAIVYAYKMIKLLHDRQ